MLLAALFEPSPPLNLGATTVFFSDLPSSYDSAARFKFCSQVNQLYPPPPQKPITTSLGVGGHPPQPFHNILGGGVHPPPQPFHNIFRGRAGCGFRSPPPPGSKVRVYRAAQISGSATEQTMLMRQQSEINVCGNCRCDGKMQQEKVDARAQNRWEREQSPKSM